MKRLMVIGFLLIATVGYAKQLIVTDGLGGSMEELTYKKKIDLIKQWAKEGIICEVYGHRWGKAEWTPCDTCTADTSSAWQWGEYQTSNDNGTTWETVKGKFYEKIRITRYAGTYRKCEICGKEQKYTPEKWEDFEEK